MARLTELDKKWQDLMLLCQREREYLTERQHPKLARFLTDQINRLATEMGFPEHQIKRREFRAVKDGNHIVRLLIE